VRAGATPSRQRAAIRSISAGRLDVALHLCESGDHGPRFRLAFGGVKDAQPGRSASGYSSLCSGQYLGPLPDCMPPFPVAAGPGAIPWPPLAGGAASALYGAEPVLLGAASAL